jgi:hypothetical protein
MSIARGLIAASEMLVGTGGASRVALQWQLLPLALERTQWEVSDGYLLEHATGPVCQRGWVREIQNSLQGRPQRSAQAFWVYTFDLEDASDDPTWYNEVSFWTSKQVLDDWHMAPTTRIPRPGAKLKRGEMYVCR